MGLKINRKAEIISKVVFFTLLGAIILVLAKIYIWEIAYYQNKTVETRTGEQAVITGISDPDLPDETRPSEKEIKNHKVANTAPRYIEIGDDKSRVINVAADNNQMPLPDNVFDINWYSNTGKPGQGKAIIMSGIVEGAAQKGAFSGLLEAQKGETITIETGDGKKYDYTIANTAKIDREETKYSLPELQAGKHDKETLILLSLTKSSPESTVLDTAIIIQANLK